MTILVTGGAPRPPADCVNIGSPEALRRVAELEVEWMLGA
jgi:hypothetical protein